MLACNLLADSRPGAAAGGHLGRAGTRPRHQHEVLRKEGPVDPALGLCGDRQRRTVHQQRWREREHVHLLHLPSHNNCHHLCLLRSVSLNAGCDVRQLVYQGGQPRSSAAVPAFVRELRRHASLDSLHSGSHGGSVPRPARGTGHVDLRLHHARDGDGRCRPHPGALATQRHAQGVQSGRNGAHRAANHQDINRQDVYTETDLSMGRRAQPIGRPSHRNS
mmetsp:Transcript_13669/g.34393  ORF Transcript_13669/g.34393 Transcript_13669/m.34393 type:complete len:220 (+) Transcript_13669:761-1420(+)